jgi:DNA-binding CsgD family transcriptional regulator
MMSVSNIPEIMAVLKDYPSLQKAVIASSLSDNHGSMAPSGHGKGNQQKDLMVIRRQSVQEMWLKGNRPAEIAIELGVSTVTVHSDIRELRKQLYAESQVTLQEHAEQTVAVLRRLQTKLWLEYDIADTVKSRLSAMDQVRKSEEAVAKVRGLLTSKVIGDVVHHVKMYDFTDKLPPGKEDKKKDKIIEAEFRNVPELKGHNVPEPEPDHHLQAGKPDFETGVGMVELPNGELIEVR